MAYLTDRKFSFTSQGMPADTFGVVRFRGSEGLSRCYEFEVLLVSDNLEVDLASVIRNPATLTFHREQGGDVKYHGILLGFEQLHSFNRVAFYRAQLVPRLYWLSLTHHNQVFLNKSVPEFIEACLKDGGLSGLDFEFRLQGSYDPQEYVCQYNETHLNFVTRWLEREGMYYYFDQSSGAEKVIFTDSNIAHTAMPQGKSIRYSPPSGMESLHMQEILSSFTCRYSLTPATVLVRDYNYLKPSLEVKGTAEVDSQGRGEVYSYGDNVLTPEDGNRVAKQYAESILCRRELYHGEGSVPYVSPGFTFTLEDHYRKGFNRGYLTLNVDHEGNQTGYLLAGLTLEGEPREIYYRNSFTSIPDNVQYRAERVTPRPRISGCISAKVDASGSGKYAELDDHGRYKVVLPFDTSGRKDGKASAWFRMASPYAGSDHGMHFPLHKDTEVLLSFMDGDPDRPVIAAAVPNPETPSPVKDSNQTMANITTSGGNKIHMEDQAGSERILMHTPNQNSFVRIGAPNDPATAAEGEEYEGHTFKNWEGIAEKTEGWLTVEAKAKNEIILGESTDMVVGGRIWFTGGFRTYAMLGTMWELLWPTILKFKNLHCDVTAENWKAYASIKAFTTSRSKFSGVEQRVLGQVTQATASRERAIAQNTSAAAQRVNALGNRMKTVASDIKAQNSDINASLSHIKTIGSKMEALGQDLHTAGLHVADSGLDVGNSGNQIINAGVDIGNAGIHVQEAPVIGQV